MTDKPRTIARGPATVTLSGLLDHRFEPRAPMSIDTAGPDERPARFTIGERIISRPTPDGVARARLTLDHVDAAIGLARETARLARRPVALFQVGIVGLSEEVAFNAALTGGSVPPHCRHGWHRIGRSKGR